MRSIMKKCEGFILIEILISGVILALSIAASMYLFNVGYQHLGKADQVYLIHSKLPTAINLIRTAEKNYGIETLGDGVTLRWKSELLERSVTSFYLEQRQVKFYVYLYKVNFSIYTKNMQKDYEIYLLKNEKIR